MQEIRVFPRRTKWTPTDDLAFVGEPPFPCMQPDKALPVSISVTFTWDIAEGSRLVKSWGRYYRVVRLGGPAVSVRPGDFTAGRFLKQGVTITSRGCPRRCPWCFVWRREGDIHELPIVPGHIIQDNNLLACSYEHQRRVFAMLDEQPEAAIFSGGLDTHYVSRRNAKWISRLRVKELWFACDRESDLPLLQRARQMFDEIPTAKMRCYVLVGYGRETVEAATERLEAVYAAGYLPFAQFYQPAAAQRRVPSAWRGLVRKWSRPAIYRAKQPQE